MITILCIHLISKGGDGRLETIIIPPIRTVEVRSSVEYLSPDRSRHDCRTDRSGSQQDLCEYVDVEKYRCDTNEKVLPNYQIIQVKLFEIVGHFLHFYICVICDRNDES